MLETENKNYYQELAEARGFKKGCTVAHFKRETVDTATHPDEYLYEYIGLSRHTETGQTLVNYKPLYETDCADGVDFMSRPAEMFFSEVDRDKYPDIKAKYRFAVFQED